MAKAQKSDLEAAIEAMIANENAPQDGARPERAKSLDELMDEEPEAFDELQPSDDGAVSVEPSAGPGPETDMGRLAADLAAVKAERDDLRDRFIRALAEAENARKRSERDRKEAENYGGSKLSRDLLPVFDNLTRAIDAASDEQRAAMPALFEGVELTLRELVNVFGRHGITPIVPEIGDRFDPQRHQAMFEAAVPGTTSGEIIQVMAHGFMLHDRLLRPAHVGVSSTPRS